MPIVVGGIMHHSFCCSHFLGKFILCPSQDLEDEVTTPPPGTCESGQLSFSVSWCFYLYLLNAGVNPPFNTYPLYSAVWVC